jgi:hypothetical protein
VIPVPEEVTGNGNVSEILTKRNKEPDKDMTPEQDVERQ